MLQSLRRYWALIRVWMTYGPHRNPTLSELESGRRLQSTRDNRLKGKGQYKVNFKLVTNKMFLLYGVR